MSTPLHYTVIYGNLNLVKFIMKHGADQHITNKNGKTALMLAAEKLNGSKILKFLLDSEPEEIRHILIDKQDDDGNTATLLAIKSGEHESSFILLDCGANVNIANKNGEKPWNGLPPI